VTNTIRTGIRMENVNNGAVTGNIVLNYATEPTSDVWYLRMCAGCESITQIESDFMQPVLVVNSISVTEANNFTGP
jgi:hypothetical protein